MNKLSKTCLALFFPLSLAWACGSTSDNGNTSNTGATGTGATSGTVNLGGDGVVVGGDGSLPSTGGSLNGQGGTLNGTGGVVATGTTACSDGQDNDDDGLIDGFDPECAGPADNDEASFATGMPGDNRDPKWQDCFFDGNSGAGDDRCRYATGCLTGELPQTDKDCALSEACIAACAKFVPNGCDCFGCCELPGGSGEFHVIGAGAGAVGCQRNALDDALACPPCTPGKSCLNDCGTCETCVDKLPDPSCNPGSACPDGAGECGPEKPCEFGDYCVTGCCRRAPEPI